MEKMLLFDERLWNVSSSGCVISPPAEVIWSLTPKARQQIYSVLSKTSANYPQYFPFRLSRQFADRFKASGISPGVIEKVSRLVYTNSGSVCFADLEALHHRLEPNEFNDVVEVLCVFPAFLLRLHVTADMDVDGLIKYWGKGGREKLIAPLINSLARVPGGGWINIAYLLPPYARLRLYTYPDGWSDQTAPLQDCTYTALNFFNQSPDTNLFDMTVREQRLNADYEIIDDDPVFGDIVTLLDSRNHILHACVYIADGFVFTKNGINFNQPWMLMRISDMLGMYEAIEQPRRIEFLRRKPGPLIHTSND
jgi:hypothetical protein